MRRFTHISPQPDELSGRRHRNHHHPDSQNRIDKGTDGGGDAGISCSDREGVPVVERMSRAMLAVVVVVAVLLVVVVVVAAAAAMEPHTAIRPDADIRTTASSTSAPMSSAMSSTPAPAAGSTAASSASPWA